MKKNYFPLLALLLMGGTLRAQTGLLTPEILWQMGRVALEDVSPDGKTAVYAVTYYKLAANKGNTDLYAIQTDGSGPAKKLTAFDGNENNARFRPDGLKIGFLKDGLLWEMNPDGSDQQQVSDMEMNGFLYAPSGNSVVYLQDVKYRKAVKEMYPDLPLANAKIIDDLNYRHWKTWDDLHDSNVFLIGYKNGKLTGEPKNLVGGNYEAPVEPDDGIEQVAASGDGRYVAYSCKKLTGKAYAVSTNTDIFLYDNTTGKTTNLTADNKGYDKNPAFSPDSRYLCWTSMATDGNEADRSRLFVYDFTKGQKQELTVGFDNNADDPRWAPDSRSVYFIGTDKGTKQIFQADPTTGKLRQVTSGVFDYTLALPSKSGLTASRTSMSTAAELYQVNPSDGAGRQLTFTNKSIYDNLKTGEVRKRMVKTTDGKDMLAWVIYPPDFDPTRKYPTLLYCQGGPQSMLSQFYSFRWNFQLMAANGYIVVAPCRRGMPGFGQAWNDQISKDWGGQAMKDLLSAIDDVKKEPYVDAGRLGAVGASYGGYSVYWLAGNHQNRFRSFIAHCGLFNLESWYGTTEELWFANQDMGGPYWDKNRPASYDRFSPHKFIQNWDTPILVIHGAKDFRVPESEGMQAFQAAQLKGVPSRFLYFEDEGHWVTKPQNGVLWHRIFFDWLDKTLKKP